MTAEWSFAHNGDPIKLEPRKPGFDGWNRLTGVQNGVQFSSGTIPGAPDGYVNVIVDLQTERFTAANQPQQLWAQLMRLDPEDGTGKTQLPYFPAEDDWACLYSDTLHVKSGRPTAVEIKLIGPGPIYVTTFNFRGIHLDQTAIDAVRKALL